jgi:hypothetical protein
MCRPVQARGTIPQAGCGRFGSGWCRLLSQGNTLGTERFSSSVRQRGNAVNALDPTPKVTLVGEARVRCDFGHARIDHDRQMGFAVQNALTIAVKI